MWCAPNPTGYCFYKSCVQFHGPEVEALNEMIRDAKEISRRTMLKYVDLRPIARELGYDAHPSQGLTMAKDWAISYYKSTFRGWPAFFFAWSHIEHIFVPCEALEQFSRQAYVPNPAPVSSLPGDVVQVFVELGNAQRGAPEAAMERAQLAMGGGVMNVLIEHVGDLTHRMSHMARHDYDGYGEVHEKLNTTLYYLRSDYGFEREMWENFQNNARARGVPYDGYWKRIREALAVYTEAHRKLPAYNEAQWLAREAAIETGELHFDLVEKYLKKLQRMQKTREMWHKAAFAYARDTDGRLLVSRWPEGTVLTD